MCHIRSYFSIEREFDRYYQLLKAQLRDSTSFDDIRDQDALNIAAARTFDVDRIWTNPNTKVPLEKAHLFTSDLKEENPQEYERLCTNNDEIKPGMYPVDPRQLDPTMIDYLLEMPDEEWNQVSTNALVSGLTDARRRNGLNLYLKTLPEEADKIKAKQLMLDSMITGKRNTLPMNKSMVQ